MYHGWSFPFRNHHSSVRDCQKSKCELVDACYFVPAVGSVTHSPLHYMVSSVLSPHSLIELTSHELLMHGWGLQDGQECEVVSEKCTTFIRSTNVFGIRY